MSQSRHPLLAQGAGRGAIQLPDDSVVPYCDGLADHLQALGQVIRAEHRAGRLSKAASEATVSFVGRLRATVMVMSLKHGRQLLGGEPMPLTIDPTESGMPTFKDLWGVQEDCEGARERLRQIPGEDELYAQAVDEIFRGHRPTRQQLLWLEHAYLERLAGTPVLADHEVLGTERLPRHPGHHPVAISWVTLVHSSNMFVLTTLHADDLGEWRIADTDRDVRALADDLDDAPCSTQAVLDRAAAAQWVVPHMVEQVQIGPYYHRWSDNDEYVQRAFQAAADPNPWLLRCRMERSVVDSAAPHSVLESFFGTAPIGTVNSTITAVALVPLALKQLLGDKDEDGTPCVVYGLSRSRDLVC